MSFEEKLQKEIIKAKNVFTLQKGIIRLNNIMIRQIFSTHHEVNLLCDANGKVIPGSGRVITNEEKKMCLDYMMEMNYPLTSNIYQCILNGYINGELNLENKEKTTKL